MGIADNVKGLLGEHAETIEGAVDSAAAAAKKVAPDQADGAIDKGAEMAKEAIKDQLT